ncbi:MAG: RNA polymerase-associated protein RapA [Gammaproteobacteria bacterium]|nr:MAG: RNA polymerase-associated protein RapA [Gammaproteobacteria bacterium]
MSETLFSIGQRWVSNSEAELGLGLIKEMSGRRIEVLFPAVGEQRTYAADIAPLSRVIYPVGDTVSTNEDRVFTISERHEFNECYVYQGLDEAGEEVSIHEMDLNSHVQFSQPQDRLFAGQVDKNSQFELRMATLGHQHRLQQSPVFGLTGARVQPLPHQMYIANQVAQRYAPRVLLADEVGLGKTIEAGLILHQQLITGRANRAIIIVPDSLVHQWLVEMLRRFNLQFTIMDEERHAAIVESDEGNPFESAQLILCSLSSLTEHPAIYADALAASWDLMIVDEAHHLQWNEQQASKAYLAIEGLARKVHGLLLLTATPEQLGVESHFARLRLLDPDRYHDLVKFKQEETNYQPVSELVEHLLADDAQQHIQSDKAIQQAVIDYLGQAMLDALSQAEDFVEIQQKAITDLLDHHGTGRILFRNTRDVVSGFPDRILHTYPLAAPDELADKAVDATPMELLQAERLLGESWLDDDPRVTWLADWLKQHRQDKILVICAQAETAQDLETYLRIKHASRSSVFHEGLSLVNRDRAAAYFADDEDGAQVLICSEIGSEGRNFQFSHHLVLFDLPLNPDLLEQRIGRLDRIGQHHNVNIHVPYYQDTAQHVLLDWYHQGMNAFERVFPAGGTIYQASEEQLIKCLAEPENNKEKLVLIKETQLLTEQTLTKLQQGRDKLLELNSCNQTIATEIVAELEVTSDARGLTNYMDKIFDAFGVEQQTHSVDSIIIEPGTHMLYHHFPALPEDGITATFHRHKALVREDMTFLSWEHPMVLGAMDMVINGDFGNSAFCTLATAQLPAGTLLLEAVFRMHCSAPRALQADRYLNESYVRIVVDDKGRNLNQLLDEQSFSEQAGRIPRTTAQELIRHARSSISSLVESAKDAALTKQAEIIASAVDTMNQQLSSELQRLQALAKVNPNIRQQEIDYMVESQQLLAGYLQTAQLTMDAVRVAIVTEPS